MPIADPKRLREIARQISPVSHVTPDDPPTLIIHGDANHLVPPQQSELMIDKLKKARIETNLIVKQGARHGRIRLAKYIFQLADWFDQHLKKRSQAKRTRLTDSHEFDRQIDRPSMS